MLLFHSKLLPAQQKRCGAKKDRNTQLLINCYFVFMARQSLMCLGFLIVEASRSNSDTPHSAGLLWTSDRPSQRHVPDKTQHLQERAIKSTAGFEPAIPASKWPHTDSAATGSAIY